MPRNKGIGSHLGTTLPPPPSDLPGRPGVKSEGQNPKPERSSKSEFRTKIRFGRRQANRKRLVSDLGFRTSFGFRPSVFGIGPHRAGFGVAVRWLRGGSWVASIALVMP